MACAVRVDNMPLAADWTGGKRRAEAVAIYTAFAACKTTALVNEYCNSVVV